MYQHQYAANIFATMIVNANKEQTMPLCSYPNCGNELCSEEEKEIGLCNDHYQEDAQRQLDDERHEDDRR